MDSDDSGGSIRCNTRHVVWSVRVRSWNGLPQPGAFQQPKPWLRLNDRRLPRIAVSAVVAAGVVGIFWFTRHAPISTRNAVEPASSIAASPVPIALPSPAAEGKQPLGGATDAGPQPIGAGGPAGSGAPPPTASPSSTAVAPAESGDSAVPAPLAPAIALEALHTSIQKYGLTFGGNPVGTNAEITRALNGDNPTHARFLSDGDGHRVNGAGELVDEWGTPYFFHQLSATQMEVHSAGPDRRMWTRDDLVIK